MGRDYFVNGESMVFVKGSAGSGIAALSQLGLSSDEIRITQNFRHEEINLDAWGGLVPNELQVMLFDVQVSINLIHFDPVILEVCETESLGGAPAIGSVARAGVRLGNNLPRFANGNHFIGLNIASPVGQKPWRFYSAFMTGNPVTWPLGTGKSIVSTNWRAIAYQPDPWGGGTGAQGAVIYDHTPDS